MFLCLKNMSLCSYVLKTCHYVLKQQYTYEYRTRKKLYFVAERGY